MVWRLRLSRLCHVVFSIPEAPSTPHEEVAHPNKHVRLCNKVSTPFTAWVLEPQRLGIQALQEWRLFVWSRSETRPLEARRRSGDTQPALSEGRVEAL